MRRLLFAALLAGLPAALPVLAADLPELPPGPPEISGGAAALDLAPRIAPERERPDDDPMAPIYPGAGFDAYAFDDNSTETGGFLFIPPDPIGAAGPDRLIAVVNVGIEARTKTGTLLYRSSLQNFFSSLTGTLGTFCFDPKIVYDHHAQRFVVVALERWFVNNGDPSDESRILLAVSKTSTPATATAADWWYLAIDSKLTIGAGDTWADYPGLEVDEEAVYVTASQFAFPGGSGSYGTRLWIVDKGVASGFYAGGTASYNVYDAYTAAGVGGFQTTTMPCEILDPGGPGPGIGTFLVSYSGLTFGGLAQPEAVLVIRVDNPLGTPSFTSEFVTIGDIEDVGGGLGWPSLPDAPQSGGPQLIEVNDRRALDAVWRNGQIYLTTTIDPNASDPVNTGQTTAHWIQLDASAVTSSASPSGLIVLGQEGNIGGEDIATDTYTFFPAIAVNSADEVMIGFSASAASIFGGAYAAARVPTDPVGTIGPTQTVRAGIDYYYRAFGGSRNRWGDYSGVAVDPSNDAIFWVFNEWADTRGTPINGEDGRWHTAWLECTVTPPLPPDLVVSDFYGPCCVYDGQIVDTLMYVEVTNVGGGAAGACQLGLYLSPDPVITVADVGLLGGTLPVPALPPGGVVVLPIPAGLAIPPGFPPGPSFLGAIVDETNVVPESDETNNTASDDTMVNPDVFGCMRANASAQVAASPSVFIVPDGSGDPLSAAQLLSGGTTDATITVVAGDGQGNPLPGEVFSLASSAGNLSLCATVPAVDGPTDAAGMATFSGPLFGGGVSDLTLPEEILVVGGGGQFVPGMVYGFARMLASNNTGDLFDVDWNSGAANPLCPLYPPGLTEIEYDPLSGRSQGMEPAGANNFIEFDWMNCSIGATFVTPGLTFNGLEWIGSTLFGTGVLASCGPSDLYRLDPASGTYASHGPTGWGPIAGLAWDPVCQTMYGVTGCRTQWGTSKLLKIDLNTGAGTLIGDTGLEFGSLEVGPDGRLYAGATPTFASDLFVLDRRNGAPALVGPTGIPGPVTGLALVSDTGIPLRFNSADLNGDLIVNLTDIGFFTSFLSDPTYNYEIDFRYDGVENLSDAGLMSGAIGATCPPPGPAIEPLAVAEDRVRFELELVGTDAQGLLALSAGDAGVARLLVRGPAVEAGLAAWEGRIEASDNLVIDGIDLVEGSLDLGRDGDFVVGFGTPLSDTSGRIEVATVRFHVKDDAPAALSLKPTTRSSVGGTAPAVVSGGELLAAAVVRYQGGAAAVINAVPGQEVPGTVALDLQPVPNPFNPSTDIRFNLPRKGQVELRVYDVRGRLIWNAQPGELPGGAQAITWRGVDRHGSAVTSGVYFYQLLLDGRKLGSPGKMTLLK